jgi:hypothetical protein
MNYPEAESSGIRDKTALLKEARSKTFFSWVLVMGYYLLFIVYFFLLINSFELLTFKYPSPFTLKNTPKVTSRGQLLISTVVTAFQRINIHPTSNTVTSCFLLSKSLESVEFPEVLSRGILPIKLPTFGRTTILAG